MKPDKTANTQYPVTDLIRRRWSARSFSSRPVTEEQVLTIIEAGAWAPSSANSQPWLYAYALRDTPGFDKLFQCLDGGNQKWCKNAAALVASIGIKEDTAEDKKFPYYKHDCGIANGYLLLQARSMEIIGHPMGGFHKEKVTAALQLPDWKEPICMMAFGYQDDAEKLEEPFRSRETAPRVRKPLEHIIIQVA